MSMLATIRTVICWVTTSASNMHYALKALAVCALLRVVLVSQLQLLAPWLEAFRSISLCNGT